MASIVSVHAQVALDAESNIEQNAYIATRSGHYILVMQGDGSVVTYFNSLNMTRTAGFKTGTSNGHHLRMQLDGNLVVYRVTARWHGIRELAVNHITY